jgi:hypothetical protein
MLALAVFVVSFAIVRSLAYLLDLPFGWIASGAAAFLLMVIVQTTASYRKYQRARERAARRKAK